MKKLILIFTFVIFVSCNSEKYELINGEWKCEEWIIKTTQKDNCNNNVFFTFDEDKTYKSKIGKLEQSGTFELFGDQLICYPEGGLRIGVKLNELTKETMNFTMSRSGSEETITLVRK